MERRNFLTGAAAAVGGTMAFAPLRAPEAQAQTAGSRLALPVPRQLAAFGPTGRDFPKVCGNLANQNHSTLRGIDRGNVRRLGGAWHVNLEGGSTSGRSQQSTIVAQDGVLYVQTAQQNVFAVDGRTGEVKWRTGVGARQTNMRGVGLGEGLVFTTSGENVVYALDQRTGAVVWQRELLIAGEGDPSCDPQEGQCGGNRGGLAGAIVYWDGLIYVGTEGSTAGARGRGYALNARTGEVAWTFWGTPGPGEYGNDTWEGETWKTGGAVCWIHPAVDPELGLVYWTFGNPYPRTNGSTRGGANLFSNCLVAIDAKTGKRRWHFQSVHHDIWDYDNVMAPVLIDLQIGHRKRKVVVYGSKVGMYYILDRATGRPVHGITERPVPQEPRQKTWPTQPFPGGEPFVHQAPSFHDTTRPVPYYPTGEIFTPFWDDATILFPGAGGGADWSYLSFSPHTGFVYVGYGLINSSYSNTNGGRVNTARPLGEYFSGGLAAVDPRTNKPVWRKEGEWSLAHGNGILTTAGRVMFQGSRTGCSSPWTTPTAATCGRGSAARASTPARSATRSTASSTSRSSPRQRAALPRHPQGRPPLGVQARRQGRPRARAHAALQAEPDPRGGGRGQRRERHRHARPDLGPRGRAPGGEENTVAQNAMSPQHLTVPVGTEVTFVNPAGNEHSHGAASFFEHVFNSGRLKPGESYKHRFTGRGEYFYNDPVFPQSTGKIVVQ
ncbi:PQQ-binding-like beta-propeller repeat protein [Actinomadura luteofluorescens]|uniref:outer membrane protein assembly factor BamB family protein n=1 Tax=Actinomadura luteofluorescens TaxID=46163 RepID=UPI003628DD83